MKCPRCSHLEDKVIDSRSTREGAGVRRRRECNACGHRFTTVEEIVPAEIYVVKRDGSREEYNPAKIRDGVKKALWKRDADDEKVDELIQRINQLVEGRGEKEVDSEQVGEIVMGELQKFDEVAYVRFASIYRKFRDVEHFLSEIQSIFGKEQAAKRTRKKR